MISSKPFAQSEKEEACRSLGGRTIRAVLKFQHTYKEILHNL